jgi:chromate transporter
LIATLLQLAGLFGLLSLLAFGGGSGVIPDMQRASVDVHHWLTAREFLDLFAISRAAPGPGSMIVVLVGQKAAGLAGAMVALVAMFGPSSLLVHVAAHAWHGARNAAWRAHAERALAPIGVGLTLASGIALMRSTEHDWSAIAITGATTLLLAFTEFHPIAALAIGGAVALLAGG